MTEDTKIQLMHLKIRELEVFVYGTPDRNLPSNQFIAQMQRIMDPKVRDEYCDALSLIFKSKSPAHLKSKEIQGAILLTGNALIGGTSLPLNERMKKIVGAINDTCNDPKIKPEDFLYKLEKKIFKAVKVQEPVQDPMKQALRKPKKKTKV